VLFNLRKEEGRRGKWPADAVRSSGIVSLVGEAGVVLEGGGAPLFQMEGGR
jgi:hypothetical protein